MDNNREELAGKIATQVIAKTAVLNDQLHEALSLSTNLATEPLVHNKVWLQIAYYGNYLLFKKYSKLMSASEISTFKLELKDQFINYAMMVVFVGNDENFRLWLEAQYSQIFEVYENHIGNTSDLLKELISSEFVSNNSKIKFIENKFSKRFLLGLAGALGGVPQGEVILSQEVLSNFCEKVIDSFLSVEV